MTDDTETDLLSALDRNNKNAALCGLYLLSEDQCTEEELYTSITGLSYQGKYLSSCTYMLQTQVVAVLLKFTVHAVYPIIRRDTLIKLFVVCLMSHVATRVSMGFIYL